MPRPRIAFNRGNFGSGKLRPNKCIESRWINARTRTLEPHAQLAGSVASSAISFLAAQILQVKESTTAQLWHAARRVLPIMSHTRVRTDLITPRRQSGVTARVYCIAGFLIHWWLNP